MSKHKTLLYTNDGYEADYSGPALTAITIDATDFDGISTDYSVGLDIMIVTVNNKYSTYGGMARKVAHILRHSTGDCQVSASTTEQLSQPRTANAEVPYNIAIAATGSPATNIEIKFNPDIGDVSWRVFVIARVITDDQA